MRTLCSSWCHGFQTGIHPVDYDKLLPTCQMKTLSNALDGLSYIRINSIHIETIIQIFTGVIWKHGHISKSRSHKKKTILGNRNFLLSAQQHAQVRASDSKHE